jgi:hypothetical protein
MRWARRGQFPDSGRVWRHSEIIHLDGLYASEFAGEAKTCDAPTALEADGEMNSPLQSLERSPCSLTGLKPGRYIWRARGRRAGTACCAPTVSTEFGDAKMRRRVR